MYDTSADNQRVLRALNLRNKARETLAKYIPDRLKYDHYIDTGKIYMNFARFSDNCVENYTAFLLHSLIGCPEYQEADFICDFGNDVYKKAMDLSRFKNNITEDIDEDCLILFVCEAISSLENADREQLREEDRKHFGGLYTQALRLFFYKRVHNDNDDWKVNVSFLMKRFQKALYRVSEQYSGQDYVRSVGEINDDNFIAIFMCRPVDGDTEIQSIAFAKDSATGLYYMTERWYSDHIWGCSFIFFTPQFRSADRTVILERIGKALDMNVIEDEKKFTLKINEYFTFFNTGFYISEN